MSRDASGPRVVAAFDFDGTLTRGDTLLPFLAAGLGWPRLAQALLRCSPWLLGYALRLLPNHIAKARLFESTLKGRSSAQMADWTARWLAHDLPRQLRPEALAQLAAHQQAGHCCVMVSASPDLYLRSAAHQLGFDALICTEMEVVQGTLTGRMQTPNCYGVQKVVRLSAWFAAQGWPTSDLTLHAYGDSPGDKPLLRLAQFAWYRGKPWPGDGEKPPASFQR